MSWPRASPRADVTNRRVPRMAEMHPGTGRADAFWHLLVGPPRSSRGNGKDKITPVEGLSALSLDALTSVAYGPEAIILVLAVAGAGALHLVLPITIAIVAPAGHPGLLLPPGHRRLPHRRRRLRRVAGQPRAHTSLVAPPPSSSTTRSPSPSPSPPGWRRSSPPSPPSTGATIPLCLGILVVITLLNLRGLGDTARAFLLPTIVFIVGLLAIIAVGLIHPLGSTRSSSGPRSCRRPGSRRSPSSSSSRPSRPGAAR